MIQIDWYDDRENLRNLAEYLIDKDGDLDTVYFLEKPWKWNEEWLEYQKGALK